MEGVAVSGACFGCVFRTCMRGIGRGEISWAMTERPMFMEEGGIFSDDEGFVESVLLI